ncbi:MAG: hypothetical protein VBE63_01315 [Lamprobacter sp.]|uniref:hypothetical protein n=1 Tax=Lamprobacter sp. TaxID=3100796 RepID=UPI002B2623F6|nr:hypothetical protein [Lamprobacter sp.]MEA3638565.1 hypothetical protein [Lamprobacter sp.]
MAIGQSCAPGSNCAPCTPCVTCICLDVRDLLPQLFKIYPAMPLHPLSLNLNKADRNGRQEYHQTSDQPQSQALALGQSRKLSAQHFGGSMHLRGAPPSLVVDRHDALDKRVLHRFNTRVQSTLSTASVSVRHRRAALRGIVV